MGSGRSLVCPTPGWANKCGTHLGQTAFMHYNSFSQHSPPDNLDWPSRSGPQDETNLTFMRYLKSLIPLISHYQGVGLGGKEWKGRRGREEEKEREERRNKVGRGRERKRKYAFKTNASSFVPCKDYQLGVQSRGDENMLLQNMPLARLIIFTESN